MRKLLSPFLVVAVGLCLTSACHVGPDIDVRSASENTYALDGGTVDPPPSGCDLALGNFDCPDGTGCVDYGVVAGYGKCEPNAHGQSSLYVLCADKDDCYGGICIDGVCSHPCAYDDCPGGYFCDENAGVPTGVCRPNRCDDPSICDEGFSCVTSDLNDPVCAKGSEGCAATDLPRRSRGPFALAAIFVVIIARRRRR